MAGKRSGTAWKSAATAYKATDRCAKNKLRKMERHLAAHPNDEQSAKAKPGSHTRKAPNNKGGWVTGKVFADLAFYLGIPKEDKLNAVSRSRAVRTRCAKWAALDRATRNELEFMKIKRKK